MKVVVEMDERDYNTMKNGFLVVGVTKGKPLDSVLDKIKAKIMSLDYVDEDKYEGTSIDPMIYRDDVLQIIDKYRESEG